MAAPNSGNASVLPIVDTAGPAAPFYAPASGGGGGGGGGPVVNASTITVNPDGGIYLPNGAGNANAQIFGYQDLNNTSTTNLNVNFVSGYQSANGQSGLWSVEYGEFGVNTAYGDFGAGRFVVLGNNAGTNVPVPIVNSDGNGGLELQAVSTLNLSTPTLLWNGAPISGGGIGPNPTFSSVTVSSLINMPNGLVMNGPGMTIQNGSTAAINDITIGTGVPGSSIWPTLSGSANYIGMLSAGGNSGFAIGATDNDGGVIVNSAAASGVSTLKVISQGNIEVTAPLTTISTLNVSSINGAAPGGSVGPNLAVSTLAASSITSYYMSTNIMNVLDQLTCQYGGAGDWTVSNTLGVSSISVSSINGAPYSPSGSAYPKVSTIGLLGGGGQTFYPNISTGNAVTFTQPFAVEQGHNYQISWNYSLLPSTTATYGQYAFFQVNGPTVSPPRTLNSDLGISTVGQGSIVFTGTGVGGVATLQVETNTTAPVNMDLGYATTNVELVDLGPIATSF